MWRDFLPQIEGIIKDGADNRDILLEIISREDNETLACKCFTALEKYGASPDEAYIKALALGAALAEIPNDFPYHGNHHYHKVLAQQIRLITRHQELEENSLTDNQIALLLVAACIHDLGHEGSGMDSSRTAGYSADRSADHSADHSAGYSAGYMEQKSFDTAKPYLMACGIADDILAQMNVMILCTDTSPPGQDNAPSRLCKAAYGYHFEGAELPKLPENLAALSGDKMLSLMAMLLHEADIATSAGIDYETTASETQLFREEMTGNNDARPSHIVEFLEEICGCAMTTPAGKALYEGNMKAILATAKAAVAAGNELLMTSSQTPPQRSGAQA